MISFATLAKRLRIRTNWFHVHYVLRKVALWDPRLSRQERNSPHSQVRYSKYILYSFSCDIILHQEGNGLSVEVSKDEGRRGQAKRLLSDILPMGSSELRLLDIRIAATFQSSSQAVQADRTKNEAKLHHLLSEMQGSLHSVFEQGLCHKLSCGMCQTSQVFHGVPPWIRLLRNLLSKA